MRQLANTLKRGDVWYIRYEVPRGEDGKRRQKMEACPGLDQKQAEKLLRKRLVARDEQRLADTGRQTVAQYLSEWLRFKQLDVSPKTYQAYERIVRCQIVPGLGRIPLAKLTPSAIRSYYACLPDQRRDGRDQKLSSKTVWMVHGVLHAALREAVEMDKLPTNPADRIKAPRVQRTEIAAASEEDVCRLLVSMDESPYRMPILIALATGMRVGEVVGLKWQDYHEQAGILTVRRSVCQLPGQVIVKDTKTGRGRPVALPPTLIAELEAHRDWQEAQAGHLGRLWMNDEGWICTHKDGRSFTPNSVTKGFSKLAQRIGICITFHGLRHTQATLALERGVPLKAISERLGHSNPSVTQGIYAHVTQHMQDQAAEAAEYILSLRTPSIRVIGA